MILTLPNPASRLIKIAALVAQISVLTWLLATEDLGPVGVFLLALTGVSAVAVWAAADWPFGALLLLTACSAAPGIALTIFGLHLRPEHVAVAALVMGIGVQFVINRIRPVFSWKNFDYFLIVYVALNFISSSVTSPHPLMTLRWATMNAIVVAPFFLVRLLVKKEAALYRVFHFLLWVGWAEAAYGIVCFLSNRIFETSFGIVVGQYGEIPGTYGTQYEANLFGSYSACCAVMSLAAFMLGRRSDRWKYGVGLGLTLSAAMISLARSVMVALPVAAFVVIWIALKKGQLRWRKLVPLALGVGFLLLLVSPLVVDFVRERFSTIDLTEIMADPTSMVRIVQTVVAVQNVQAHPILGTGTASFQLLFDWDDYAPGIQGENTVSGWVGNTPLRILNDTGILGLAAFLSFIGGLALSAWKVFRRTEGGMRAIVVALAAGVILYAITFQATEATMLAFTWVQLGLLGAAVQIVEQNGHSQKVSAGK